MQRAGRATSIIWKTVVSAGAMLGVAACACKAPPPAQPVVAAAPEPAPTPVETAPAPPPVEPAPPVEPVVAEVPPAPTAPAKVSFIIETEPQGADVYFDDQLVGKTPLQLQLPANVEVNVRVTLAGYAEKKVVAMPTEGKTLILQVVMAKDKKAAKTKRPRGTYGTIGHGSGTGSGKSEGRGFILS